MDATAQAQQVGDYWEGHPQRPADDATAEQVATYEDQLDAWRSSFGPGGPPEPPTPPEIPGPPTPGAGMPAARAGDLTAHGGTIGPVVTGVAAKVLIGGQPAAVMGDPHVCPMCDGPKPHVGGTILKGSATVVIANKPVARVSDTTECKGPPGAVALGCVTVLIGDLGATARPGTGYSGGRSGSNSGAGDERAAPEEPRHADTEAPEQPPGESEMRAGNGTHWLEIELVDEAEQPVVGESYAIKLPGHQELGGRLDARGQVRITGIAEPGWATIRFPKLDLAAWERWRSVRAGCNSRSAAVPDARSSSRSSTDPATRATLDEHGVAANDGALVGSRSPGAPDSGPVPPGPPARNGAWHTVRQGECVASIAADHGLFWRTVWEHPANAELNHRRNDPNVLLPGDAVFVPQRRPKEDAGSIDQHHKFRRRGIPEVLRIVLYDADHGPRSGVQYVLSVDGREYPGATDDDGVIEQAIPPTARRGELIVQGAGEEERYALSSFPEQKPPPETCCHGPRRETDRRHRLPARHGPRVLGAVDRAAPAPSTSDRRDPHAVDRCCARTSGFRNRSCGPRRRCASGTEQSRRAQRISRPIPPRENGNPGSLVRCVTARDQAGRTLRLPRQRSPVIDPYEEIARYGLPRFDLDRDPLSSGFDQKIDFMARRVAPEVDVRLDATVEVVLDGLRDNPGLEDRAARRVTQGWRGDLPGRPHSSVCLVHLRETWQATFQTTPSASRGRSASGAYGRQWACREQREALTGCRKRDACDREGQRDAIALVADAKGAREREGEDAMTMNLIKRSKLAVAAVLVAASLANVAQAGRRGGPGYTQTTVAAFSSDRFCIDFRGGERARIVADGDGDTDLDLFVYDDCGRLVAADDDGTDFCVVEFWVPRGQSYTVVIRNLGGVCNVYTLGTN